MTTIVPLFRGESWQDRITLPIDPERVHRYGENSTHADACYHCGRRRASDYHRDDVRQRTVSFRAEYAA